MQSGLAETSLCGGPVERNIDICDGPLCELSSSHVGRHRLHDLAMRNLANEIIEGLLALPDRERPEFAGEWLGVERVANEADRSL